MEKESVANSQRRTKLIESMAESEGGGNLPRGEEELKETNDVQSIEGYIAQWGNHLAFAIKHLFEAGFKFCNDVFERVGLNVWMDCFSKIDAQAGMLAFLQFGKTVTDNKKDPIKLLKLLDIFTSLNKLRADFIRLFGGAACIEIQNFTMDLIKRLIDGAAKSFWELLVQVLLIHKSWRSERFQDNQLMVEVLRIIKTIEQSLAVCMKVYPDQMFSHFFGMNNHWHLYKNLKGTIIGDQLGDSWLKEHD